MKCLFFGNTCYKLLMALKRPDTQDIWKERNQKFSPSRRATCNDRVWQYHLSLALIAVPQHGLAHKVWMHCAHCLGKVLVSVMNMNHDEFFTNWEACLSVKSVWISFRNSCYKMGGWQFSLSWTLLPSFCRTNLPVHGTFSTADDESVSQIRTCTMNWSPSTIRPSGEMALESQKVAPPQVHLIALLSLVANEVCHRSRWSWPSRGINLFRCHYTHFFCSAHYGAVPAQVRITKHVHKTGRLHLHHCRSVIIAWFIKKAFIFLSYF